MPILPQAHRRDPPSAHVIQYLSTGTEEETKRGKIKNKLYETTKIVFCKLHLDPLFTSSLAQPKGQNTCTLRFQTVPTTSPTDDFMNSVAHWGHTTLPRHFLHHLRPCAVRRCVYGDFIATILALFSIKSRKVPNRWEYRWQGGAELPPNGVPHAPKGLLDSGDNPSFCTITASI